MKSARALLLKVTPAAVELAEATSVRLWDRDTLQSFMKEARR